MTKPSILSGSPKVVCNMWSDAARQAAELARKATEAAAVQESVSGDNPVPSSLMKTTTHAEMARLHDTAADVQEKILNGKADMMPAHSRGYALASGKDKAVLRHRQAASLHRRASAAVVRAGMGE